MCVASDSSPSCTDGMATAPLTASAPRLRHGLGFWALVAGFLAQYVSDPLEVPYAVFIVALAVALLAIVAAPETREPADPRPHYRPQRVAVPDRARPRYFAAA